MNNLYNVILACHLLAFCFVSSWLLDQLATYIFLIGNQKICFDITFPFAYFRFEEMNRIIVHFPFILLN